MLTISAILSVLLDPRTAAMAVSIMFGRPDIAPRLVEICQRESRCQPIGVHERDAHLSRAGYRSQVRLGHLDPSCQRPSPRKWATRGAFGLSAASHWAYLPACYQPHWLDVPLVSAYVAAAKYLRRCDRGDHSGVRWCGQDRRRTAARRFRGV